MTHFVPPPKDKKKKDKDDDGGEDDDVSEFQKRIFIMGKLLPRREWILVKTCKELELQKTCLRTDYNAYLWINWYMLLQRISCSASSSLHIMS